MKEEMFEVHEFHVGCARDFEMLRDVTGDDSKMTVLPG